jgi:hypothetical protein
MGALPLARSSAEAQRRRQSRAWRCQAVPRCWSSDNAHGFEAPLMFSRSGTLGLWDAGRHSQQRASNCKLFYVVTARWGQTCSPRRSADFSLAPTGNVVIARWGSNLLAAAKR